MSESEKSKACVFRKMNDCVKGDCEFWDTLEYCRLGSIPSKVINGIIKMSVKSLESLIEESIQSEVRDLATQICTELNGIDNSLMLGFNTIEDFLTCGYSDILPGIKAEEE